MTTALTIQPEPPDTAEARALIGELDTHLGALYEPDQCHGLSVAALLDPRVIFLVARWDSAPVGCGAVKFFGTEYAEVKRMYVRPLWRGRGIAQALLGRLEQLSQRNGYGVMRLETGIHQPEAIRLYEQIGYSRCPAFGEYADDGVSLCYEKRLPPVTDALSAE